MATMLELALLYLAVGAVCFAHPKGAIGPADFTPRGQWAVFLDTLPQVLSWPLALCR
jgi:hypothetical protein